MKNALLIYAKVFFALLVVDWILGAGRFAFPLLVHPFLILNFPWSLLFLGLEKQPASWWQASFGIDDEIGQFIAFFGMIALQAGAFAFLYWKFLRKRGDFDLAHATNARD